MAEVNDVSGESIGVPFDDEFVEGLEKLSLTSRDTEVELTDFEVNPANSMLTGTVTANCERPPRTPRCSSRTARRRSRSRPSAPGPSSTVPR